MYSIKELMKRSKEEKEKILLDIKANGLAYGIRKYGISKSQFYEWQRRYNSLGLEGLEDKRKVDIEGQVKRLQKENETLKKLLGEKELEGKIKDELLKKKIAQWNKGRK
jgi:putative transposase